MAGFDRYVVVDWSASAAPTTGRDSIWIADRSRSDDSSRLVNPSTRVAAWSELDRLIDHARASGERVLIGVDVGLGYPAGSAATFGFDGRPWRALWRTVAERSIDDDRNRNNRFEVAAGLNRSAGVGAGPFWGCPHDRFSPALERMKPTSFPVPEYREVEARLRSSGAYPKSCWQLLGAGSVGGQTLTFLPGLWARLDRVSVWPLTTGLERPADHDIVVVAEIWPSRYLTAASMGTVAAGTVPDAAQVAVTAEVLAAADASGELTAWFHPCVRDRSAVVDEEGWILGVE